MPTRRFLGRSSTQLKANEGSSNRCSQRNLLSKDRQTIWFRPTRPADYIREPPEGWVEAVKNPVDKNSLAACLASARRVRNAQVKFLPRLQEQHRHEHKAKYRHRRHFAEKAHLLRYYEAVLSCPAIAMLTTESGSLPRKRSSMPS